MGVSVCRGTLQRGLRMCFKCTISGVTKLVGVRYHGNNE